MRRRHWIIIVGFALAALFGHWLASTAVPAPRTAEKSEQAAPKRATADDDPGPRFRTGERKPVYRRDAEAADKGALVGQRSLVFKDRAALEDFLKRAGDQVRVLGRLDALNALKIGFLNYDDLASLLDGSEELSLVFPVDIPAPGTVPAQADAVALGAGLLEWLGITADNSEWGKGVKIAILDTGVTANKAFSAVINALNLVGLPSDLSTQNAHGTAVASMIIGQSAQTPGVAPGADILSVRIANELGQSDSFLLAQGIVAAVDGGAKLINISLGSPGDSALVRNAIEYASAAGAVIVASAGNNGTDRVLYPAANAGVIAVGAVDAVGAHLDFSNTGNAIALAAPGFQVNAAWTGDQAASVSGTSFSSPIVVGAIAALMSRPDAAELTAQQAVNLLFAYLNDGGDEGRDTALGAGMPDIGRALAGKTPGIYDAAVASQRIVEPGATNPTTMMEIMVQNRGTETLVNTTVSLTTPGGVVNSNITTLAPNAVRTIKIPISSQSTSNTRYNAQVTLAPGFTDIKRSNDRSSATYTPAASGP